MNRKKLIENLNEDLKREYSHWHYYMAAAEMVVGPHREEFQEFFMKEASGEMQHILEFSKLIRGLGGIPTMETAQFRNLLPNTFISQCGNEITTPIPEIKTLLTGALHMETEVVANFVQRMDEAEAFGDMGTSQDRIDGRYIQIFLEEQMMDSRGTVDHLKQMLSYNY